MSYIGKSIRRVEDKRLVSGEGTYIDDLSPLSNIQHAAILRSPHAHAVIKKIDVEEARKTPGVIGVVDGQQVKQLTQPLPVGVSAPQAYYPIAVDKVRYVGEPVVVIVAENRYIAEDALEKIKVEYEPLQTVVQISDALSEDSIPLHEEVGSNILNERHFDYGNVDQAFEDANYIIKRKFEFPKVNATPVENYGVIADYTSSEENYTIWSNFHGPFTLHSVMKAALNVPSNQLRIITPKDIGGSYGIKSGVYPYMVLIAVVSRIVGVPVKWIEDRQEHLMASSSGTDRVTWVEAAVKNNGTILGLKMKYADNVGAYIRAPEPASLYRNHSNITGAYRIQNVRLEAIAVTTNKSPTGLIRGYGGPQHYFPLERMIQIISEELNIDVVEVVERNLIQKDEFPYLTASGGMYDSGDYHTALQLALDSINYKDFKKKQKEGWKQGKYLGIGFASIVEPSGSNMGYVTLALTPEERAKGLPKSGAAEGATVSIDPMGGITVRISTVPTGQGHETVAAQIVADTLGVESSMVKVIAELDTSTSPWTVASGSYSSRFAPIGSSAIYLAAHKVKTKLLKIAAKQLETTVEELTMGNGKVYKESNPGISISLKRLIGTTHWNPEVLPEGLEPGLHESAFYTLPEAKAPTELDTVNGSVTYGFVFDAVKVEVDINTGEVKILDYFTVHDAGKLLNPKIANGQILGGLTHGLGAAIYENLVYDKNGQLLTGSFMDYLVPTATEIPNITIKHIETPSPLTVLGAKGLGEGNTMSAPAVIANAVTDALKPLGVTIEQLPLSPDYIWNKIHKKKIVEV
ncbi:xanthine dehydrogenase family protein molybdopterin-binding subunit [Oceanobacillus timonensis]|uniref:xanthine dehydrogenase family protein molybdopterin-binding subunit n=1 Tax=Oceanobacillus timonensis TaxID=1926285 RepID=UPI0009BBE914|nr:xanthine dehydrogenase family protein molybdopterin-binding subunit [Oceanobacillus timonensis]